MAAEEKYVLATGLSSIEEKMESQAIIRCYHRSVLLDVVREFNPQAVVLSPHLKGEEDLIKDIIIPLREANIRVVFLPGSFDQNDAREWIKKLVPWGIYCYVFDPVNVKKIQFRLDNEGSLKDLPEAILQTISESSDMEASIKKAFKQAESEKKIKSIEQTGKKIKKPRIKKKEKTEEQPKFKMPQIKKKEKIIEAEVVKKPTESRLPAVIEPPEAPLIKMPNISNLFVKTGFIQNGTFKKEKYENMTDLLKRSPDCDAIVVPASWGLEGIKQFRHDTRSKTTLLVVLKGKEQHASCGADYCVRRLNKRLISEITHVSQKTKQLWQQVDSDALTGLYSRSFMDQWLEEQILRETPFSMVIIDIDYFKEVNDTYGHSAGDAVLSTFGDFIKSNIYYETDLAFRYGGDEFVVILPYTDANQSYVLIERLRKKWEERAVILSNGQNVQTTFTAGVAEWSKGCDVKKVADEMLYKAKESGRNQVQADNLRTRALVLGKFSQNVLREEGIDVTYDPEQASVVVAERDNIAYAPSDLPIYVIGKGDISDWLIKKERPDAVVCTSLREIANLITGKPKLQVLPGVRTHDNNQTIAKHGAIYVVCPSRPAAAGEIAADLCKSVPNCALVCASPESTAAVSIGISSKKLITADWRIVGSDAPIDWAGVKVWPIDPYKHLSLEYNIHKLVDEVKPYFSLVVVDCAGSLNICTRMSADEGVLLLHREGDASDFATANWLKMHSNQNVLAMSPSEEPYIIEAENGFVVSPKSINRAMGK